MAAKLSMFKKQTLFFLLVTTSIALTSAYIFADDQGGSLSVDLVTVIVRDKQATDEKSLSSFYDPDWIYQEVAKGVGVVLRIKSEDLRQDTASLIIEVNGSRVSAIRKSLSENGKTGTYHFHLPQSQPKSVGELRLKGFLQIADESKDLPTQLTPIEKRLPLKGLSTVNVAGVPLKIVSRQRSPWTHSVSIEFDNVNKLTRVVGFEFYDPKGKKISSQGEVHRTGAVRSSEELRALEIGEKFRADYVLRTGSYNVFELIVQHESPQTSKSKTFDLVVPVPRVPSVIKVFDSTTSDGDYSGVVSTFEYSSGTFADRRTGRPSWVSHNTVGRISSGVGFELIVDRKDGVMFDARAAIDRIVDENRADLLGQLAVSGESYVSLSNDYYLCGGKRTAIESEWPPEFLGRVRDGLVALPRNGKVMDSGKKALFEFNFEKLQLNQPRPLTFEGTVSAWASQTTKTVRHRIRAEEEHTAIKIGDKVVNVKVKPASGFISGYEINVAEPKRESALYEKGTKAQRAGCERRSDDVETKIIGHKSFDLEGRSINHSSAGSSSDRRGRTFSYNLSRRAHKEIELEIEYAQDPKLETFAYRFDVF